MFDFWLGVAVGSLLSLVITLIGYYFICIDNRRTNEKEPPHE